MKYLRIFESYSVNDTLYDLTEDLRSELEDEFQIDVDLHHVGKFHVLEIVKNKNTDHIYFHEFLISHIDRILDMNTKINIDRTSLYFYGRREEHNIDYQILKDLNQIQYDYNECKICFMSD